MEMESENESRVLKEITQTDLQCKLCSLPAIPRESDRQLGALYEYGMCRAHLYCLMFSSGLEQNGEDDEGIKGFLSEDIVREWKRGGCLKCCYCKKKYSTVGCVYPGCRKCYHLPCGIENGSLQQFFGNFSSYCGDHRPAQKPLLKPGALKKSGRDCGICLDVVHSHEIENLWTPCCGGWFHRSCMNRMASTAGLHFFKCPLCNNTEEFTTEMQNFGIYVPDQDAKWETEGDAFNDLLVRPDSCDAKVCVCPGGRKVDELDTRWETVICVCCGSQGIHIECGGLNFDRPRWKCDTCRMVLRDLPRAPVSVFQRVKRAPSLESSQMMEDLLRTIRFKVKAEKNPQKPAVHNIQVKHGRVRLSIESSALLDLPQPVNLAGVLQSTLAKDHKVQKREYLKDPEKENTQPLVEDGDIEKIQTKDTSSHNKSKCPLTTLQPEAASSRKTKNTNNHNVTSAKADSLKKSQTSILMYFKSTNRSEHKPDIKENPQDGKNSRPEGMAIGKIVDETTCDEEDYSEEDLECSDEGKKKDDIHYSEDDKYNSEDDKNLSEDDKNHSKSDKNYSEDGRNNSEHDKIHSESYNNYSEDDNNDSEHNKIHSEYNKNNSGDNKNNSEEDKTYNEDDKNYNEDDKNYSEDDKIYSEDDNNYSEDDKNHSKDDKNHSEDDKNHSEDDKDDRDLKSKDVKGSIKEAYDGTSSPAPRSRVEAGFVCRFCRISFSSCLSWKQHENSHKGGIRCAVCDEKFATSKQLTKHEKSEHSGVSRPEDEEFSCTLCDYTATKLTGLKIHQGRAHSKGTKKKDQQLTAGGQQLTAGGQQLTAGGQPLTAGGQQLESENKSPEVRRLSDIVESFVSQRKVAENDEDRRNTDVDDSDSDDTNADDQMEPEQLEQAAGTRSCNLCGFVGKSAQGLTLHKHRKHRKTSDESEKKLRRIMSDWEY